MIYNPKFIYYEKNSIFILGLILSVSLFASSDNKNQNQAPINVSLEKRESDNEKPPRTLIPITCVYVDGTVQLTILENLGEMALFVTNQTTGEQWSTVNNWVLQTSTAAGVYLVEIVTESGDTYWGTYIL